MQIKELFNTSKGISRYIESVISYGMVQPDRLKSEITEYVVTDKIEEQFGNLLRGMQYAMDSGGEHEVGVWVSGFYGSGKSSFTKYLGFAFDKRIQVEGQPFARYLGDRISDPEVKALLNTINTRFPAAVVMVDLASDMIAGSTMEDVATVLYFKVLQWAKYSQNLKVAALERRLEKDGKMPDFLARFAELLPGMTWEESHNDLLCIDELIPGLAHEFYPTLYKSETSFNSDTSGHLMSLEQQVDDMLDIVRQKSGMEHVLFIVDEVGQYVSSRPSLITNLDGLAKLIKRLGAGKAWIFATAQQTLTEDDHRAALNSAELYKLKDRFPIRIDLESSDIKEICYRRLLGKSPMGAEFLGKEFDAKGPTLRQATKLEDAGYYAADFDRADFINLYPFLPAHFEILLNLLGALAKSTGGIGLRSAIKVVRDILVEEGQGRPCAADNSTGWLATSVTLFDALEKDIERAFPSIYKASHTVSTRFPGSALHAKIAKCITVLQILGNLPITAKNVAALIHDSLVEVPQAEAVKKAIEEMVADPMVPLTEDNGHYHFISEKLRDIEAERGEIPRKSSELRRLRNEALRELFDPLPEIKFHGSMSVRAGVKTQGTGGTVSLAGESNDIQMAIEFSSPADLDAVKARLVDDSRAKAAANWIYLAAPADASLDDIAGEAWQSIRIAELHRSDPDPEIREYCRNQEERANTLNGKLKQAILTSLGNGVFLFQGGVSAAGTLDPAFGEAAKKMLKNAAEIVFSRYDEASERVDTALAEKLLRLPNLAAVTTALDPLGFVKVNGGTHAVDRSHRAIMSVKDHLDHFGSRDGKALLEVFSSPPYGWSQDTIRYILAAMLLAGMIELKVSGVTVKTNGQHAIDGLKTNRSFSSGVSVALRDVPPDLKVLAQAADRVTRLTGQMVNPLENEICAAVQKHFPRFQAKASALEERLSSLGVPGTDKARLLRDDIAAMLFDDASNAPNDLGADASSLYDSLRWEEVLSKALDDGLDRDISGLTTLQHFVAELPVSGIPGELKKTASEELEPCLSWLASADFHLHGEEFRTALTGLETLICVAATKLEDAQKAKINEARRELVEMPEFKELNQESQVAYIAQLEALELETRNDLDGFKARMARDYDIGQTADTLRLTIKARGQEIIRAKIEAERKSNSSFARVKTMKTKLSSLGEIDALIKELTDLKAEAAYFASVDITLKVED